MAVNETDKMYAAALKQLRKKHRLIQYAMASHLGFESQQQYSDLEKGKKHFTNEIIIKICKLFHISILDFNTQSKKETPVNFLSSDVFKEIAETSNRDLKMTLYKKLFLETKIENIETRLRMLCGHSKLTNSAPGKHKVYVII